MGLENLKCSYKIQWRGFTGVFSSEKVHIPLIKGLANRDLQKKIWGQFYLDLWFLGYWPIFPPIIPGVEFLLTRFGVQR